MTTSPVPGLVYFNEAMQRYRATQPPRDVSLFVNDALRYKLPLVIKVTLTLDQLEELVTAVHSDMIGGYTVLDAEVMEKQWFHVQEVINQIRVVQLDIVNALTQLNEGVFSIKDIDWRV